MNTEIKKINVDECYMIKLEKAFYEYANIQNNISFMLDAHKNDNNYTDSIQFKNYHDMEAKKLKELEAIKNEITIRFIPEELLDEKHEWEADFENNVLLIRKIH